jgi:hypothetical protein
MDFMSDRLLDGRAFRVLTIVDQLVQPRMSVVGSGSVSDGQTGGGMSESIGLAARQAGEPHRGQRKRVFAAERWTLGRIRTVCGWISSGQGGR